MTTKKVTYEVKGYLAVGQVPDYYIIPVRGKDGIIPISVDDIMSALSDDYRQKLDPFTFSKVKDSVEYLLRCTRKSCRPIEDLEKARLCLDQAIQYLTRV